MGASLLTMSQRLWPFRFISDRCEIRDSDCRFQVQLPLGSIADVSVVSP